MEAFGFYHGKCTVSCRNKCNFKYYFLEICVEKRAEILCAITAFILFIYGICVLLMHEKK